MNNKITYLLVFLLVLTGSISLPQKAENTDPIQLLSSVQLFTAGDTIELKFSTDSSNNPKLYVSNSYGSTLLTAVRENELLVYTIPASFGNKSGIVNWRLTASETDLSGHFYIKPKAAVKSLESYLGPPSIQAGGTDFSMLVVIPTDALDNPLEDSTVVNIKTHFRASEDASEIPTRYFLAYKNIYSPEQTGRILISSESSGVTSKEFDINVLASLPTDFKISEQRNHKYADGNQIVTLSTSKILDRYGNVIEDGTLTEFFIKNQKGAYLKTAGTTVNGVANAQIIHPDQADEWTVKAIIQGMAESDTITFNFEQIFDDFEVSFSDDNRRIAVGPLKSFMEQLVPDGFHVRLSVFKENQLIQTISKQTLSGKVNFMLNPDILPEGNYTIKINTAGLEKVINSRQLW